MTVPVHGLPPLLQKGLEVAAVPPELKTNRWHTVLRASEDAQGGQLVLLSEVNDIDAASQLVGKTILACVDDLPADLALLDLDALIGREIVDEVYGPLGAIVEILQGPAQDVWVVEGPLGEVLIPAVEAILVEVPDKGSIRVRVPAGTVQGEGE